MSGASHEGVLNLGELCFCSGGGNLRVERGYLNRIGGKGTGVVVGDGAVIIADSLDYELKVRSPVYL